MISSRILATSLVARWRYETTEGVDWNKSFDDVRSLLLETFATTYSRALQEDHSRSMLAKEARDLVGAF